MPTPVTFDGVNVVIAKNQEPYIPLPAQFFGDGMGTVLTCWEFSPEEMEEFLRTRRLWISHWTFNQAFQPLCPMTDRPVNLKPEQPVAVLTLFDCPAEWMPNNSQIRGSQDELVLPKGYTGEGWYFWNLAHDEVFGPHESREGCEANMLAYAREFDGNVHIPCSCGKTHEPLPSIFPTRTEYLDETDAIKSDGWTKPGWYYWDELRVNCTGPFKDQAEAIAALVKNSIP